MSTKTLTTDLDNCLINFTSKVLVTNLLDEYGGLLEEVAKTVQEFLVAEEKKGKEFEKIFLLSGRQPESEDEVITLVPDEKLQQRKEQLRDATCMLYSAEIVGGSKSPPTPFVPLRQMAIKLDSLVVKDSPMTRGLLPVSNGTSSNANNATKEPTKKTGGALGAMFKKQEATTAANAKPVPETSTPKKLEAEKKADKSGSLGAMFKKQEAAATKKSPKAEPEKKANPLGAMFKKQEATAATKKSPTEKKDKSESKSSKKGLTNFVTNKEEDKKVKPVPKKVEQIKVKEEPNVSVNLFEESEASSDDEEALDALKREVLTDDEDDKPATSSKRRRIIDSDDEDTGPEVKVERKEVTDEAMEVELVDEEDEEPKKSETFLDEDGFIVTKKPKKQSIPRKPNPTPVKLKTPTKVKKESPKSASSSKKKDTQSKTPAPKTKQGNIMNFFTKK
ncbi:DNA polymerase delta subunit 3 [Eupeodes corollae]|uniref:DNA polymerase delta subunit 3 n=1 Tax=Eupeodes corollae TaxID=290404 RepID=UPI00248F8568|nr:DNA polymerase delta subunit 3 [Eupeodes corollae]